jgi:hypothetical protein
MVVMGVITVTATAFARETFRDDIDEARPEERRFFREGEGAGERPAARRAEPVGR